MTVLSITLDIHYWKKGMCCQHFQACHLKKRAQRETDSRPRSWSQHHLAKVRKGQSHHMLPNQSHITDVPPKTHNTCINRKKQDIILFLLLRLLDYVH